MPNQSTRNIIDYALDENGIEFRKELYASIHDRVAAHIESKKQEIAGSIFGQNEEVEELGEYSLEDYSLEEIQDFMQTEDFEQLDELSKEKLGNYIKRASMDASERAYNAGSFSGNNKPGSVAYKKGYHNSVTKQLDIHGKRQTGIQNAVNRLAKDFMKTDGYDSRGAYEKHDPKHPDFAKNYKKYKATNPQGQIGDFVAHMKKQK